MSSATPAPYPQAEETDFPRTGVRARRWYRFERDLHSWLATNDGRFAAWRAAQDVSASGPSRAGSR